MKTSSTTSTSCTGVPLTVVKSPAAQGWPSSWYWHAWDRSWSRPSYLPRTPSASKVFVAQVVKTATHKRNRRSVRKNQRAIASENLIKIQRHLDTNKECETIVLTAIELPIPTHRLCKTRLWLIFRLSRETPKSLLQSSFRSLRNESLYRCWTRRKEFSRKPRTVKTHTLVKLPHSFHSRALQRSLELCQIMYVHFDSKACRWIRSRLLRIYVVLVRVFTLFLSYVVLVSVFCRLVVLILEHPAWCLQLSNYPRRSSLWDELARVQTFKLGSFFFQFWRTTFRD